MATQDIVAKLWNLCHIVRDDGITYHQYVTELTYLLFLKMARETGAESQLPMRQRWSDLVLRREVELLSFYHSLLRNLGKSSSPRVRAIYANASSSLKRPAILRRLVQEIDALDWYSSKEEGLGDLYEGLLEKNASETKSGAGQYFTPRSLIDSIVAVIRPQAGEIIQDPATGTAGFLIAADQYIKRQTKDLSLLKPKQRAFQRSEAYYGIELVEDTRRLALMNLMLHDIEAEIVLGDTLSVAGTKLPPADAIITNPPFGTKKGGGIVARNDLSFPTSNKQLAFLQHVYLGLKPGGRAAVVVPDNVLFENNVGTRVRADLLRRCNLHTILRLPTGIFYAPGVQTNVLFFTRAHKEYRADTTSQVWYYDLRTNMPQFGRRTRFLPSHLASFERAFGDDPLGSQKALAKRQDTGVHGRFRKFTREFIADRAENLDITWLRDTRGASVSDHDEPATLAAKAISEVSGLLEDLQGILREFLPESAA